MGAVMFFFVGIGRNLFLVLRERWEREKREKRKKHR